MTREEFLEKIEKLSFEKHCFGIIPMIFPLAEGEEPQPMPPPEQLTAFEAGKLYDFLEENGLFKKEIKEEVILGPTKIQEILVVEDGSCDTDDLEDKGYNCIVYRQGSTPPFFIKDKRKEE